MPLKFKIWRHDAMHRWEPIRNEAYLIDSKNSHELHEYSLITTVYNESNTIEDFLDSVLHQQHKPNELIICDGGSSDNTLALINAWRERYQPSFKIDLVLAERCSIAKGRNLAARQARNQILVFGDAGTSLDKLWAQNLVKGFIKEVDFVCGWYKPIIESDLQKAFAWFILPKLDSIEPETFIPSARSLAIRKDVFDKVGGFPEHLSFAGEDTLFGLNVKSVARAVAFCPDAFCHWRMPKTMSQMVKTTFRYAKGDAESGKLFWTYYVVLIDKMAALFIHLFALLFFLFLYFKWGMFFYLVLILFISYFYRALMIAGSYSAFVRANLLDIFYRCLILKVLLPAQLFGFISGLFVRLSSR